MHRNQTTLGMRRQHQVGVYLEGRLAKTGYVIDFGLIKKLTKEIVDRLDERTIVPRDSDCLTIDGPANGVVRIRYEQDEFVLPAADVCIVPIVHSSAEELARYIWWKLAAALDARGALTEVTTMEVSVAEGPVSRRTIETRPAASSRVLSVTLTAGLFRLSLLTCSLRPVNCGRVVRGCGT